MNGARRALPLVLTLAASAPVAARTAPVRVGGPVLSAPGTAISGANAAAASAIDVAARSLTAVPVSAVPAAAAPVSAAPAAGDSLSSMKEEMTEIGLHVAGIAADETAAGGESGLRALYDDSGKLRVASAGSPVAQAAFGSRSTILSARPPRESRAAVGHPYAGAMTLSSRDRHKGFLDSNLANWIAAGSIVVLAGYLIVALTPPLILLTTVAASIAALAGGFLLSEPVNWIAEALDASETAREAASAIAGLIGMLAGAGLVIAAVL